MRNNRMKVLKGADNFLLDRIDRYIMLICEGAINIQ
jgi:hypothetical protein